MLRFTPISLLVVASSTGLFAQDPGAQRAVEPFGRGVVTQ